MRQAKGFTVIEVVVVIVLLALVGGGVYVWQNQKSKQDNHTATATPTPTSTPTSSPIPTPDPAADWMTYQGKAYAFKYPADWKAEVRETDEYYGHIATIKNPTGTVNVQVTQNQQPYGFSGDVKMQESPLIVAFNGTELQATERKYDNNTFVDFDIKHGDKEYNVVFGTGYPAAPDDKASPSDYQASRETILQILKTFTIR